MKTTVKIYSNENYAIFNCYNILFEDKPDKTVLTSDTEYFYIIETYKNIEVCRKIEQNIDGTCSLYTLEYNETKLIATEFTLKHLLHTNEISELKREKIIKFANDYLYLIGKYTS